MGATIDAKATVDASATTGAKAENVRFEPHLFQNLMMKGPMEYIKVPAYF